MKAFFVHVNAYNLNLMVQDAVLNVSQYCDATSILRILIISLRIYLSTCSYSRAYSILLPLSTIVLQNLVNTVLLFNQLRITINSFKKFFMQLMKMTTNASAKAADFPMQLGSYQTWFHIISLNKIFTLIQVE